MPKTNQISKNGRTERVAPVRLYGVVSLGDYVLASKYSDRDPQDPWRVGFVVRIIRTWRPHPTMPTKIETSYIIGERNGTWSDFREYKCAKKITAAKGKEWLEAND